MVSVDLRCCLYGHHHHHPPVSPQPKTAITVIALIYPCRVSTGKVCDVRFRTDALFMGLYSDALRPILTVTCCTCSDQERTERKSERERESGVEWGRESKRGRKWALDSWLENCFCISELQGRGALIEVYLCLCVTTRFYSHYWRFSVCNEVFILNIGGSLCV